MTNNTNEWKILRLSIIFKSELSGSCENDRKFHISKSTFFLRHPVYIYIYSYLIYLLSKNKGLSILNENSTMYDCLVYKLVEMKTKISHIFVNILTQTVSQRRETLATSQ